MTHATLSIFALIAFATLSSTARAENHLAQPNESGVIYGNDDCNNDASYLTENNIICSAVFSNVKVWDFLNGLPRRITLDELMELNPRFGVVDFETVLPGITFVRVQ